MTYKTDEWDSALGKQITRDATREEIADIEARKSAKPSKDEANEKIRVKLLEIDMQSIRPMREGDKAKLQDLNDQAAALRAQIVK